MSKLDESCYRMCSIVSYTSSLQSEYLRIPVNGWYLWIPSYRLDSDVVKYFIHKKSLSGIYSLSFEKVSNLLGTLECICSFLVFSFISHLSIENQLIIISSQHISSLWAWNIKNHVPSLLLNTRRKRSSIKASINEGKRETLTLLQWKWSLRKIQM